MRHAVDRRQKPGQFILPGSAVPGDLEKSATGRYAYTRPDGVHVVPVDMLRD